jgi:hypothetical protein
MAAMRVPRFLRWKNLPSLAGDGKGKPLALPSQMGFAQEIGRLSKNRAG